MLLDSNLVDVSNISPFPLITLASNEHDFSIDHEVSNINTLKENGYHRRSVYHLYDTPLLVSQRWFIQNTMILSNILVTCKLLSSVCNVEMILVNMFVYFTLCVTIFTIVFFVPLSIRTVGQTKMEFYGWIIDKTMH